MVPLLHRISITASLKAHLLSDDSSTRRKQLNANNLFIGIALQYVCRVGILRAHSHLSYNVAILRAYFSRSKQ